MAPILKRKQSFLWLILIVLLSCMLSFTVSGEGVDTEILSDFDVFNADVRDVFRSLAEIGNINVLLDPTVKGEATVKLKHGLKIKEAIEMLAQTYGYSYRWITASRTVLIGNEKTFSNFEAKETRIYQFSYANIVQVAEALKVIIPKEQIGIDKRTNQLTIRASVLEHQNIAEIVTRLDREMPQINIEARIEEVSRTATRELGVSWDPQPQTWEPLGNINFHLTTITTIKALEQNNKAKLLANPNISTTDSQEGKIFIGDKYPVITSDSTEKGIIYKIEYIEIGTMLTVIPRINENDVVTVIVKANVSNILEWRKAGNNDIPVIRSREASSVIRLKEGETFVLSGLNMNKNAEMKQETPGLSKIPLLGSLFTSKKTGPNEDTEILIFLTPKIVRTKPVEKLPVKAPIVETSAPKPAEKVTPTEPKPQIEQIPAASLSAGTTATKPEEVKKEPVAIPQPTPTAAVAPVVVPAVPAVQPASVPVAEPVSVPATDAVQQSQEQAQREQLQTLPTAVAGHTLKYTVKQGDTLAAVTEKFGVSSESVVQANKLEGNTGLTPGKEIMVPIPDNQLYTLKPKETLWRLAKRYGVSVELLMELNSINDYSKLEINQVIILPVSVDRVVDNRF